MLKIWYLPSNMTTHRAKNLSRSQWIAIFEVFRNFTRQRLALRCIEVTRPTTLQGVSTSCFSIPCAIIDGTTDAQKLARGRNIEAQVFNQKKDVERGSAPLLDGRIVSKLFAKGD